MPQIATAINKYGDSYSWTPLKHFELVEFIETKRINSKLKKIELSTMAGYAVSHYASLVTGAHRFSKDSFQRIAKTVVEAMPSQLQIELDKQPEKIEAPAKVEKPIYGVMSIEQMITKIKAAGYKVMRRTEGWEEI
jgi:hypothetical protein